MRDEVIDASRAAIDVAVAALRAMVRRISETGGSEENQVYAYKAAQAYVEVEVARVLCAEHATLVGPPEGVRTLVGAVVVEAVATVAATVRDSESYWGAELGNHLKRLERCIRHAAIDTCRSASAVADLAEMQLVPTLSNEYEEVRRTYARIAHDHVDPIADALHRAGGDIPEMLIQTLAKSGAYGLIVPEQYGGQACGAAHGLLAMTVASEELSRASMAGGGSLLTRPAIVARVLLRWATDEQRTRWLPRIASGEAIAAVAVTEPSAGSDVAAVSTLARRVPCGWAISGTKTWCTMAARANVLLLLARTAQHDGHRPNSLSLFLLEKPPLEGLTFDIENHRSGRMQGSAIATIGYKGMRSYDLVLDDWYVEDANLVGGANGVGNGFSWLMDSFGVGRLQTAARALGVMQAAYEAARIYTSARSVFGKRAIEHQLVRYKLGRMLMWCVASQVYVYHVSRLPEDRDLGLIRATCKIYTARAAEWISREAMQLHGGAGYAESAPVSRYFVDARLLPLFEGADEVLSLKVVARGLEQGHLTPS